MTRPRRPEPDRRSNLVNRRTSRLNGSARREIAWQTPDGVHLISLDVTRAAVAGVSLSARVSLVQVAGPITATGPTPRQAYRRADRLARLAAHDTAALLRENKRLHVGVSEQSIAKHDALARERVLQDLLDAATKRAEAAEQRVAEDAERKLTAAHAENLRLLAAHRTLQAEVGGLKARHATLQGRCDDLCRQLGLPTRAELAVPPRKPAPAAEAVQS